jgi:5'-nucleotidase/UDP-sugar diphosphatase
VSLKTVSLLRLGLIACMALTGCRVDSTGDRVRELTVLYTNDEHGWMEGVSPGSGAANLYQLWRDEEAYAPDGPFLVLSGGDNWTGPAVSTWTRGQSMVAVMNAMHYAASAVGNHEFDFGLDTLAARAHEAEFPYLSANTRWRATGEVPMSAGIQPYTLVEVNGLRVGIIGLTTTSTYRTTMPTMVTELEFREYEPSLRQSVAELRAQDVDLLFVIAHVCMAPLHELAERVADLGIHFMGGGHCNELEASRVGDTVLLGGGYFFTSYAKARFRVDTERRVVQSLEFSIHDNRDGMDSDSVSGVVAHWRDEVEALTVAVVGYNSTALERGSPRLRQAIVESWLLADPTADVALTNAGGIRDGLPAGTITSGSVAGIMPFDNTIVAVTLHGAALRAILSQAPTLLVAGVESKSGIWHLTRAGEPLRDDGAYRVLVNSFMYAGGDGLTVFAEHDPDAFDTGINYRQPFLDWLIAQDTNVDRPLQLP